MTKNTPGIRSKPFASKPISGPSKPFAHQKLGRWDPYFCKKEESCKFLFAHILSNDTLYAYRIPLASFESWDFGPKIGLDGLDGLAQVWTPLPLDARGCSSGAAASNRPNPELQRSESPERVGPNLLGSACAVGAPPLPGRQAPPQLWPRSPAAAPRSRRELHRRSALQPTAAFVARSAD